MISNTIENFKSWFVENGGYFHPHAQFQQGAHQSSLKPYFRCPTW